LTHFTIRRKRGKEKGKRESWPLTGKDTGQKKKKIGRPGKSQSGEMTKSSKKKVPRKMVKGGPKSKLPDRGGGGGCFFRG